MNIGWAVETIKNGGVVRRATWARLEEPCTTIGVTSWVHLYYEEREEHMPAVMARRSDGKACPFVMTDSYLLADDWELA